ncbi:monooxygenase [Ignatzschineria indica]|nr:monooxygenase [Ignatzschineria indica]GGZ86415.1 monooxygenase [Ignatzschineria indica]
MILVQMNFDFPIEMMGDALTEGAKSLAESINQEPGFLSKIWIENSETAESGGIYLFKDRESAENYVAMHCARVEAMGAKNISVKYFSVNEPLSAINQFTVASK